MSHVIILNNKGKQKAAALIDQLPDDGSWMIELKKKTVNRSINQNKTQFMWCKETAEQKGDDTADAYRAYCKLHFGIPILRSESDEFRDIYDRIIRPHTYEEKIELMQAPIDFPVTRIMTTDQFSRYLTEMLNHFTSLGVILSDPSGEI